MKNAENMDKGILTLAIGRKYITQARYLAYSCILHCPSLPRAIITDEKPECLKGLYDVVIRYTENMGDPFYMKLQLHRHSPFFETLFLDADTLVYKDLRFMWDHFDNRSIVYYGECIKEGNWYIKDVAHALKAYDIPWVGLFNSGSGFLFRKDEKGMTVLDYAARLYREHKDIEIPFFRGECFPDEPFLGIAFGKYNQSPISDFGQFGHSLICASKIKLDIIKGISKFIKTNHITGSVKEVSPAVVHFTGNTLTGNSSSSYYASEKIKLLFNNKSVPVFWGGIAGILAYTCVCIFHRLKYKLKRLLIMLGVKRLYRRIRGDKRE